MNRLSKSLIAACAIALVVGLYVSFTNESLPSYWTIALPLGAILYGLALIVVTFHSEAAKYDKERREELDLAAHNKSQSSEPEADHEEEAHHPDEHSAAHAH